MERGVKDEEAQREAERSALRKVRKALDGIEAGEDEQRRWRKTVVAVSVVLFILGAALLLALFFAGKAVPRDAPIQVPGKVIPKE
jgi:hypothetical protein